MDKIYDSVKRLERFLYNTNTNQSQLTNPEEGKLIAIITYYPDKKEIKTERVNDI